MQIPSRLTIARRDWKLNHVAPVTISVMLKSRCFSLINMLAAIAIFGLSACSPTYNWREVRGTDAPFVVLLPAKPATHSRPINLDGFPLTMTMTAAEVAGITFAVGSAKLPEQAAPHVALNAMKIALVRNIGGTIRHEKSALAAGNSVPSIEIEAVGIPAGKRDGQPLILFARFTAKDQHIYQAVVVGQEKAVTREAVDTFFTSFKLN